jgi:transposase
MGESDLQTDRMFCYNSPETFVPPDHPLRPIRIMVEKALSNLSSEFTAMYSHTGHSSVPPETLLKALLLQAFYSIRSIRLLMERIHHDILFRWFVGLSLEDGVWDPSTFSQNQERLLQSEVAKKFFDRVLAQPRSANLLSDEHFMVDGTLIEAWASLKSFRPRDEDPKPSGGRNDAVDFKGQKRKNDTHASTTDPQARLYRKGNGQTAKMSYIGNVLMENRHGLVVDTRLELATGTAECEAALDMLPGVKKKHRRVTVGGDKGYDNDAFVRATRKMKVVPHVVQNTSNRESAIDGRTTCHPGYKISLRLRKRVEEIFGWMKTTGGMRRTRYAGQRKVGWHFTLVATAYNLVRMRTLLSTA